MSSIAVKMVANANFKVLIWSLKINLLCWAFASVKYCYPTPQVQKLDRIYPLFPYKGACLKTPKRQNSLCVRNFKMHFFPWKRNKRWVWGNEYNRNSKNKKRMVGFWSVVAILGIKAKNVQIMKKINFIVSLMFGVVWRRPHTIHLKIPPLDFSYMCTL